MAHREGSDDHLRRGVDLFREGEFFEAHEALEDLWKREEGERKVFVQGLLQAAVACHHLRAGNVRGAVSLYRASRKKLAPHRPVSMGLRVDLLLEEMDALLGPLDRDRPAPEEIGEGRWPRPVWLDERPLSTR